MFLKICPTLDASSWISILCEKDQFSHRNGSSDSTKAFLKCKRKHVKLKLPTLLDGWTMYSYIYSCQLVLASFLFVSHQAWTTPELESFGTLHWHWTLTHTLWASVGTCCWIDATDAAPCRGKSATAGGLCAHWLRVAQRVREKPFESFWVSFEYSVWLLVYIYFFSVRMFTPVFRVNQISSRFGWLIHLLLLRPVSRPY